MCVFEQLTLYYVCVYIYIYKNDLTLLSFVLYYCFVLYSKLHSIMFIYLYIYLFVIMLYYIMLCTHANMYVHMYVLLYVRFFIYMYMSLGASRPCLFAIFMGEIERE
jgi:hypothetical protein